MVQERLGHTTISITLDVYRHVLPNMQEEAAAKIGAALSGRSSFPRRTATTIKPVAACSCACAAA